MTIDEYKEMFGLCKRTRTTESTYQSTMRSYSEKYGLREHLIKIGEKTRIKKGDNSFRKDKKVRLQEILEKKDRKRV